MALGMSTQSSSPFKKPSFPALFLFSSSPLPSSWRCFWASSRKAVRRQGDCALHNVAGPSPNMVIFSSSFQFKRGASYNTMSSEGNVKQDDMELYLQSIGWKLEVSKQVSNPSISHARMLPDYPPQSSTKENSSGGSSSLQRLGEENEQGDSFSASASSGATAIQLLEKTQLFKDKKGAGWGNNKNGNRNIGILSEVTTGTSVDSGREGFEDGSTCYASNFYEDLCPLDIEIASRETTLQHSRNSNQSDAGNGALRGSTGERHLRDASDQGISTPRHKPTQQVKNSKNGEGDDSIINGHASHMPVSTEQKRSRRNYITDNKAGDPPLRFSREHDLSSMLTSPSYVQLEWPPSEEFLEEWDFIKSKHIDGSTSVSKATFMPTTGQEPNPYKRLLQIYDKVSNIDVKQETPVDHGEITCFSIYCGPEANFGNGKSCIWVDVLDGGGKSLLVEFAPFFEDPSIKKVWHNYSFDRHVIENYGIKVSGFHADTMHLARLWDSSRRTKGGYSLEALTGDPVVCGDKNMVGKVSMKNIFGRRKLKKDGSEGKIITIPPVEELQREERKPWICYSALDAMSTLKLYENLKSKLSGREWKLDGSTKGRMIDFYEKYWRPFGEILVEMEAEGMLVDRVYLAEIEKVAQTEQQVAANRFRRWASKYCPDAKYMNVGSDAQLRQLFFGGAQNSKDPNESLPDERDFKIPNVEKVIEKGKKTATKFRTIRLHRLLRDTRINPEIYTASGWPSASGDALKTLAGKVSAEFSFTDESDSLQTDANVGNLPETKLPGVEVGAVSECTESSYGTAYAPFGGGEKGKEACHAIAALCEMCSIDSLLSNFILPLQGSHISGKNGRIHCSLNINTETGRLSARRPNLQNQPALEKDRYKIRQAFIAAPGNSLIVADYGQLELRILAHLANCKSMLDAFEAGGDFHSRTAMNMYPHIRKAVDQKHVLLEWHPQPGEEKPPVPLLKDAFASERRKAKMLNFSIAYGKTPVGLARDWKVSVKEAKETVDLWYNERHEVRKWQEERKREAQKDSCVHTLLGRVRHFPSMKNVTPYQKGHIERAAINTPVQGSAADVAMCAMIEISKNARLKELGWRLLLQVHDEVILEGPTESGEEAKAIVVDCMSKPFDGKNILQKRLSRLAVDWVGSVNSEAWERSTNVHKILDVWT
ncbi:hypothetical protein RHMOL_Rhmol04G0023900 [Rhododendron molle]|uniref:Uncharacterized protein n=1 Tax=Rhododendron molle TaxID=49168 RepID=A0ACC0NXV9_RHOML|nr:hypothetical protein RHMOL_Rhmol04G0023900 [Rhododendron molle]